MADTDILCAALPTAAWTTHEVRLPPHDRAAARNEETPGADRLSAQPANPGHGRAPACPPVSSGGRSHCDNPTCDV